MTHSDTSPYTNSVFEQPWWLEAVSPGCWHEAQIVDDQGAMLARWPYVVEKSWLGNSIVMPPLTQTLGPWMSNRSSQPGNTHLRQQKEQIAVLLGQMPKSARVDLTLDAANKYVLPFRWKGYTINPTFSYRIENLEDLDAVYASFSKTVKKNIRAASHKVTIRESYDIEAMYCLLSDTFAVQKRRNPISHDLVCRLAQAAFDHKAAKLLLAYDKDGEVHSGALLVYDSKVCYYLLGGTAAAHRNSAAQNLVLWEAIKFAATVSQCFDFEGSMVEGIEQFFRQYGGQQIINYRITKSGLFFEIAEALKPRIKRLIGYKN